MARLATGSVGRQIESLFDGSAVAGLTDRQLLERFTAARDSGAEAAFAALVTRHGPMVLGICRQILGDHHHAEDAFQAVFLVLACKARSIRNPDLVESWLFGVALRTAQKTKARLSRQRKNEEGDAMNGPRAVAMVDQIVLPADISAMARERAEILRSEVARLPKAFQLPLVLFYFEGLSLDQAAKRLRWRTGTLSSRLARAREKLRRRLTRRGLVLPSVALMAALGPRSAPALVSTRLCASTARAALDFAAEKAVGGVVSNLAAALAQDVLRSMLIHNLKVASLILVLLGAIAAGAALLKQPPAIQAQIQRPLHGPTPLVAKSDGSMHRPVPGRMFVTGRVLDPEGKPVPNAATMIYARLKEPGRGMSQAGMNAAQFGQGRCDGSGRFRIDTQRSSSARNDLFGAVALAPGYGVGWVELDPDAEEPAADITLRPEQVIEGRLFDVHGEPARNVSITVGSIFRLVDGQAEGPRFSWAHPVSFLAWPQTVTSDGDGRFTIRGVGRNLQAILSIDDPRFARVRIPVETDNSPNAKQVTRALEPAKIITGRVTYADTGRPVPNAPITILAYIKGAGHYNEYETNEEGRFHANPLSADRYSVSVLAPEGQPYLYLERGFDWTKGALEHSIDFALPRGAVIHGKVTEAGSGKPIAAAWISFDSGRRPEGKTGAHSGRSGTGPDGAFRFAVPPGPGYLVVKAPSDDYVFEEIGSAVVHRGRPGGLRFYANAFVAGDIKPESTGWEVNVELRRGVTVKGEVVGPDGKPVQDASMISRVVLEPYPGAYRRWRGSYQGLVRGGRFELHGLDPDNEVPVFFIESKGKLGATVNLSGKSAAGGPITVAIKPCGMARARLVGPGGNPLAGYRAASLMLMVITPGSATFNLRTLESEGRLAAEQAVLGAIDPTNYRNGPVSDADGKIEFPALIPGATYRVIDRTMSRGELDPQVRKEFRVESGETLDLGNVLIEGPPG